MEIKKTNLKKMRLVCVLFEKLLIKKPNFLKLQFVEFLKSLRIFG